MKDIHINIDNNEKVSFPDGTCLGVQGEHLATQLLIQLPKSLLSTSDLFAINFTIDDTDVRTPTISSVPNADGSYLADGVIHFPLTCDYTFGQLICLTIESVQHVGSAESIVDSSEPVHGLYLLNGHGEAPKPDMLDHVAEQIYRQMVKKGVYRVQSYSDLNEYPCNRANEGDYVEVMLPERYSVNPGIEAIKAGDFCPIVFFNPSPSFPFEIFPNAEPFPLTGVTGEYPPKERIIFKQGTSTHTTYILSLEYNADAGEYLVFYNINTVWVDIVTTEEGPTEIPREEVKTYIYSPKNCAIPIENDLCRLHKGWNYLMHDDEGVPYFEPDKTPSCITDVTCLEVHSDSPISAGGTTFLRHLSALFCQNYPYAYEHPAGKYVYAHGAWRLSSSPRILYLLIPPTKNIQSDTITVPCNNASSLDTAAPVLESQAEYLEVVKCGDGWITLKIDRTKYKSYGASSVAFVFVRGSHRTAKDLMKEYRKWESTAGKYTS